MTSFQQWKLRRLRKKHAWVLEYAEAQRKESFRLGMVAYYMDQFATPLTWGRTQHEANVTKYREREALRQADELAKQIKALEGELS